MCSSREHISVEGDSSTECKDFSSVCGRCQVEYSLNAFGPRLNTLRSEPISKEVSFLDSPFTLEGVDGESIMLEAL